MKKNFNKVLMTEELLDIWNSLPLEQQTPEGLWKAIDGDNRTWPAVVIGYETQSKPTPQQVFRWATNAPNMQGPFTSSEIQEMKNFKLVDLDDINLSPAWADLTYKPNFLDSFKDIAESVERFNALLLGDPNHSTDYGQMLDPTRITVLGEPVYKPSVSNSMVAQIEPLLRNKTFSQSAQKLNREREEAYQVLEIALDEPNEYYDNLPLKQLVQEAAAIRWLKTKARQGQIDQSETIIKLQRYILTGTLGNHTLTRFLHLLVQKPSMHSEPDSFEPELYMPVASTYVRASFVSNGKQIVPDLVIRGEFNHLRRQRKKPPELYQRVLYRLIIWKYPNAGSWEKAYDNVILQSLASTSIPFEFKTFENNKGWAITNTEIADMGTTIEKLWTMYIRGELQEYLMRTGGNQGKIRGESGAF